MAFQVNQAAYDEKESERLENRVGHNALWKLEGAWYQKLHKEGWGGQSAAAFREAFGEPQVNKKYEDVMSIYTFYGYGVVVWCLVSPRGAYWEWDGKGEPADALTLIEEVLTYIGRSVEAAAPPKVKRR